MAPYGVQRPDVIGPQDLKKPSPRQQEVLELVALGLTNGEIGGILGVTRETIKSHVRDLLWKMDARNRVYLVTLAWEQGLITRDTIKRARATFLHSPRNRGPR